MGGWVGGWVGSAVSAGSHNLGKPVGLKLISIMKSIDQQQTKRMDSTDLGQSLVYMALFL